MTCKGCEERDKIIERMTALLVLDAVCPCCEELRAAEPMQWDTA